jgi:hypothetical protein
MLKGEPVNQFTVHSQLGVISYNRAGTMAPPLHRRMCLCRRMSRLPTLYRG